TRRGRETLSILVCSVNLSLSLSFSPSLCLVLPNAVLFGNLDRRRGIRRSAVAAVGHGTVGQRLPVGVAVLHGGDGRQLFKCRGVAGGGRAATCIIARVVSRMVASA